MIKKYWKIIIIALIIITAGGVYYNYFYKSETTAQTTINPRNIMVVEKGSLLKTIAAEGFIQPIDEEDLSFPSKSSGSTKVKKIYVKEGDRVEKGQLLMELDKTEAQLNYIQKQNSYNRAKINGSKSEIEEARLDLELASLELENLDLKAPFSGIITDIDIEEGGYYNSGDVATIKDISRLKVEVSIEESDIPLVKLGQKAKVTLSSLPGIELSGEVVELGNEANNDNSIVTLPVTVLLEEVDYDIKLGVSADVDIIVGEVKDKVIIPITAIVNRNGRDFVMKVVNGKIQEVPVETGLSDGLNIVVESGLEAGDKILINTFQQAPGYGSDSNTKRMMGPGPGMMGGRP